MKRNLIFIMAAWILTQAAYAIPTRITYQGTLKENGVPANGLKTMKFDILNGKQSVWSTQADVQVSSGLFSVALDPVGVSWETIDPYLQVTIGKEVLSPAEPITANAYAVVANTVVDKAVTTSKLVDGAVTASKVADGAITPSKLSGATQGTLTPPGIVLAYAGAVPPAGWLVCDGAAVSRTTYANLFAAIGITWGVGDGVSTFNLPDFRGRTIVGTGTGAGLSVRSLGQSLGEESHQLTTAELPAHNHGINDSGHSHSITDPGHNHVGNVAYVPGAFNHGSDGTPHTPIQGGNGSLYSNVTAELTGASNTGVSVNSAATGVTTQIVGSNSAHNNMQPSAVATWVIKY